MRTTRAGLLDKEAAGRKSGRPRGREINCIRDDLAEKVLEEQDVNGKRVQGDGIAGTATPCERWDKLH